MFDFLGRQASIYPYLASGRGTRRFETHVRPVYLLIRILGEVGLSDLCDGSGLWGCMTRRCCRKDMHYRLRPESHFAVLSQNSERVELYT